MVLEHSHVFVFFGATGNLACRRILPSLEAMVELGDLNVPVISVAKDARDHDRLRRRAA